ncbi:hypothetical protein CANCADRAFT_130422 [Tortispora caseinolytica NRRL Y-17796]|uniref:CHY-type domain-containing protein n=1 Tax=Tortispora caseinolytica NRRL Y-17796 TaxID=767744 RepID=A0A1E4TAU2_9ASCO|nr:hypothetical protein CANCADRAFT_130422 [Tortispora caseinolytica NRRL Y-17796]
MATEQELSAKPPIQANGRSQRQIEIDQLKRRYKVTENSDQSLRFAFPPSDPDFPYEISNLQLRLYVPENYPQSLPHISVLNTNIPLGYSLNIEKGFTAILTKAKEQNYHLPLLRAIANLDRRLEEFLKLPPSTVIKVQKPPDPVVAPSNQAQQNPESVPKNEQPASSMPEPAPTPKREASHTEKLAAQALRQREIRLLLSRIKNARIAEKQPGSSSNEEWYIIPLQPPPHIRSRLSSALADIKTIRLCVPYAYNLEPPRINILGSSSPETKTAEYKFNQKAGNTRNMSLLALLNYFYESLPELALTSDSNISEEHNSDDDHDQNSKYIVLDWLEDDDETDDSEDNNNDDGSVTDGTFSDIESDGPSESGSAALSDTEEPPAPQAEPPQELHDEIARPSGGVALDLPGIKLTGIAILQYSSLNLVVRCRRCKTTTDIEKLHSTNPQTKSPSVLRTATCPQCSLVLSARFYPEFVHEHSNRLGYLELENCSVVDLLPSNYICTCMECSEMYTSGIKGLYIGQPRTVVCRSCHAKMSVSLNGFKVVIQGPEDITLKLKKKEKENLHLVAGSPLPQKGVCKHYRRSTRWFRFSCCKRVFPCDRCHNEKTDHMNEFATRMICGACSIEQPFRQDYCIHCKHQFVKKNSGFWEGGKGTRDKTAMSRRDPRKYKRIGSSNK